MRHRVLLGSISVSMSMSISISLYICIYIYIFIYISLGPKWTSKIHAPSELEFMPKVSPSPTLYLSIYLFIYLSLYLSLSLSLSIYLSIYIHTHLYHKIDHPQPAPFAIARCPLRPAARRWPRRSSPTPASCCCRGRWRRSCVGTWQPHAGRHGGTGPHGAPVR